MCSKPQLGAPLALPRILRRQAENQWLPGGARCTLAEGGSEGVGPLGGSRRALGAGRSRLEGSRGGVAE